jgi:hypothetical protein
MGLRERIASFRLRRREETVRDFLGVVEIETDPKMGVLVLPDHVATLLRVSGTDYAYASESLREDIVNGWATTLNSARLSLQIWIDRRPAVWDLPGGFLDTMRTQVKADLRGEWQERRLKRWEEALMRGELNNFPVMETRSYIIVRYAMGTAESRKTDRSEAPMYLPPRRSLRFWEKLPTAFGDPERGLPEWRRRRADAIRALTAESNRLINDSGSVPGLSLARVGGLEMTQTLQLAWNGGSAYDEWVGTEEALVRLRRSGGEE